MENIRDILARALDVFAGSREDLADYLLSRFDIQVKAGDEAPAEAEATESEPQA